MQHRKLKRGGDMEILLLLLLWATIMNVCLLTVTASDYCYRIFKLFFQFYWWRKLEYPHKEKYEDTTGVFRSLKSNDRYYNGHRKKRKQ